MFFATIIICYKLPILSRKASVTIEDDVNVITLTVEKK